MHFIEFYRSVVLSFGVKQDCSMKLCFDFFEVKKKWGVILGILRILNFCEYLKKSTILRDSDVTISLTKTKKIWKDLCYYQLLPLRHSPGQWYINYSILIRLLYTLSDNLSK